MEDSGPSRLSSVLDAWRRSPGVELREPASDADIDAAEVRLGRPLPADLRRLYRFSDGLSTLDGNLILDPLEGGEQQGVVGLSDRLRQWGWPIPDQLLMFGGNGADEQFGLWYPAGADREAPTAVVMVGAIFEPACLALVGTDLSRFLRAWSGYYLVLTDAPEAALNALGLPDELRRLNDEAGMAPYFAWADPTLPDPVPDPYERRLDAETLDALLTK